MVATTQNSEKSNNLCMETLIDYAWVKMNIFHISFPVSSSWWCPRKENEFQIFEFRHQTTLLPYDRIQHKPTLHPIMQAGSFKIHFRTENRCSDFHTIISPPHMNVIEIFYSFAMLNGNFVCPKNGSAAVVTQIWSFFCEFTAPFSPFFPQLQNLSGLLNNFRMSFSNEKKLWQHQTIFFSIYFQTKNVEKNKLNSTTMKQPKPTSKCMGKCLEFFIVFYWITRCNHRTIKY